MEPISAHPTAVLVLGAPGAGAPALARALRAQLAAAGAGQVVVQACEAGGCAADLAPALDAARAATLVLLAGLDGPCPADQRPAREAADARVRAALASLGIGYRVVYGAADESARLAHALQALVATKTIAAGADGSSARGIFGLKIPPREERPARLRAWNCEKCSDPECEHRLFTALVEGKGAAPSGRRA